MSTGQGAYQMRLWACSRVYSESRDRVRTPSTRRAPSSGHNSSKTASHQEGCYVDTTAAIGAHCTVLRSQASRTSTVPSRSAALAGPPCWHPGPPNIPSVYISAALAGPPSSHPGPQGNK
ncbi:hypothetical protein JB92DRAFT_3063086 [Gautieria morchelliformis]|nr:hypothetical protein JB92DRAFT_3063086 [Gautieria morchelliformis]